MVGTDHGGSTSKQVDASSRASFLVAAACLLLLAALAVPAVLHARLEARRVASANNLKNLALGLVNYQHSHRRLPQGASLSETGEELHGWLTLVLPWVGASQLPGMIDKSLPWEYELNAPLFHTRIPVTRVPQDPDTVTTEGYAVLHYLANPRCMYRGSRVDVERHPAGRANIWLTGEALAPRTPWGYPFNWRALEAPIGQEGGYGADWDGAQFVMGDGRVAHYSDNTDSEVLAQLRSTLPAPEEELVARPARSFEVGTESIHWLDLHPGNDRGVMFRVSRYSGGQVLTAIRFYKSKGKSLPVTAKHIEELYDTYPDLSALFFRSQLSDKEIRAVVRLKRLRVLSVGQLEISASGVNDLAGLKDLHILRAACSAKLASMLRKALPQCELHLTVSEPMDSPRTAQ